MDNWYPAEERSRHLPGGLELDEFSFRVAVQFSRAADEKIISVEVMPAALC